MSEPSNPHKPSKLTPVDAELLWAIFEGVPRRKLSSLVDWADIGEHLGLSRDAVTKRWSRLNIKMREESEAGDTGESGTDDQKAVIKNTGGEETATKELTPTGPVNHKPETDIIEGVATESKARIDEPVVATKQTSGGKVTTKKRSRKAPIKKAITGKSKEKATWESIRAEVEAEAKAKAKERRLEEDVDSEDQGA